MGVTALHYAAAGGDALAIACLLQHGACVNARDAQMRTPLLKLLQQFNPAHTPDLIGVMQQMVDAGADLNAQEASGFSAILIAIEGWKLKQSIAIELSTTAVSPASVVRWLLESGDS